MKYIGIAYDYNEENLTLELGLIYEYMDMDLKKFLEKVKNNEYEISGNIKKKISK